MSAIRGLRLALVATMCGLAAATFTQVFALRDIAVPLAAAVIGATAVCVACSRLPYRRVLSMAASVAAMLAVGAVVVVHGTPDGPLVGLWRGFADGWARILSTTLPAGSDPVMLFVPFAVTWVGTAVACEMTLSSDRAFSSVVPAGAIVMAARLFGGKSGPSTRLAVTGLLIAAVVLGAVSVPIRRSDPGTTAGPALRDRVIGAVIRRRALTALLFAVVLASVAVLLTPHLPTVSSRQPVLLRDHWTPPLANPDASNPLDDLAGLLVNQPATREFSADTSSQVTLWRMITLDSYEGVSWSTSARFVAAGSRVDPGTIAVARTTVRQHIVVDALSGVWLPAAPISNQVKFRSLSKPVAVDPASGSFALRSGVLRPGVSYEAESVVPAPSAAQQTLASLQGTPPALRADAQLTSADASAATVLSGVANDAMAAAMSPWVQLVQLQNYLVGSRPNQAGVKFVYDPQAASGQSLNRIVAFLTDPRSGGVGTPVQFATAFALVARTRGFPTRVAVGFKSTSSPQRTATGWHYEIARGDAYAWPEVYLGDLGWTAFDPTPAPGPSNLPGPTPSNPRPTVPPPVPGAPTPTPLAAACANPLFQHCNRPAGTRGNRSVLYGFLVALILLIVAICSLPLIKSVRAGQRRRGTPAERIAGAWAEAIDRLREAGVRAEASTSSTDVVTLSRSTLGPVADRLEPLAQLRTVALFGPFPPSGTEGDRAWELLGGFERAMSASTRRLDRLRGRLDPRPLARTGK